MAGMPGRSFSVAELETAGVRRISLGTSLYKAAMSHFISAATDVRDHGCFDYVARNVTGTDLTALLRAGAGDLCP